MEILARPLDVVGIESQHGIRGRILPEQGKCLQPGVEGALARPFHVLGRGERLALCDEHASAERYEKEKPSKYMTAQDSLADQAPGKKHKQQVQEMQVAHGLKRAQ